VLALWKGQAEALAFCERESVARPEDAEVQYCRANLLFQASRWAEALPAFEAVLALQPSAARAQASRTKIAACRRMLGK